ncbi:DEKNAAC102186 [Brettanomyces naardenensis]|uniref:Protein BFR2 n=1 Tax=Brettanomyces naardenensis TaxID=13370 RepID=A0A448YK20_BRENA|nr:DEKNAAC102186 [Brettanomyces naardenensis]
MGRKPSTLGEQITEELLKPKNKDVDIEDVGFNDKVGNEDESGSEVEGSEEEDDEQLEKNHYVSVSKSKLRSTTVNIGGKYLGEMSTRAEIFGEGEGDDDEGDDDEDDHDEGDDDDDDDDDNDDDDDVGDEVETEENDEEDIFADVTDSEDESLEDESPGDLADEQYKRSQIGKLLDQEKKQIISRLSTSARSDALKGYSIIQQYKLFDKILDARIKLQKALTNSNELPVNRKSYEEGSSASTGGKLAKVTKSLEELLGKILVARAALYNKDGISRNEVVVESKKRTFDDYLEESQRMDSILKTYRKSVLVKWSNKVQSVSGAAALNDGKFKTINQNVYVQLENTMQDMDRLVKRTRMNRRRVIPIGYEEKGEEDHDDDDDDDDDAENSSSEDEVKKYQSNIDKSLQENAYVFDDDDFYRVLLNDMVDKKITDKQATSSAAIVTLSRSKVHKNYDRMATKGRKIRYTVQEQLRNFEAPKSDQYSWNDDQIDQLFASLLGQKVNMSESDEEGEIKEATEDVSALRKSTLKLFG